ncbi:MAG: hypothetical protein Q9163_004900 [Psora crenata]
MATVRVPVEGRSSGKPIRRARGPHVLTFLFTFFQPVVFSLLGSLKESPMKAATKKHPYVPPNVTATTPAPPSPYPTNHPIDNIFIDALARACCCRRHACNPSAVAAVGQIYPRARQGNMYNYGRQARFLHQVSVVRRPSLRAPLSRDKCLNMLDYYAEDCSTQATWQSPERTHQFPHPLIFGPQPQEHLTPKPLPLLSKLPAEVSEPITSGSQPGERSAVDKLLSTLDDLNCTHHEAWAAYSALPSPGVAYITESARRRLLQRLATIQKKGKQAMLRYLSVVDEMKRLDIPLIESEWNSALAFAAHCFHRITAGGVEAALLMWKEMEQQAKVKSGNVTFNILFDMATKAGKFVLAEMILKEMEARDLHINRFARVGLIYYHGVKGDGGGVRRAYREFVQAGEIVDTVVMNCVIASLIRAGELSAAEHVYERMKRVLHEHTGRSIPHLDWREPRRLGRILNRAARQYKDQPAKLQQIQDEQFLAPSRHTFAIFVEHHATYTGELRRIATLLSEMQDMGIPISGRIFVKIFKGFTYHGGVRYTAWTKSRLENVWESLLDALNQGLNEGKPDKWMTVWAVRAFSTCCSYERTLEIWEELRTRWKPRAEELEQAQSILQSILNNAVEEVRRTARKLHG